MRELLWRTFQDKDSAVAYVNILERESSLKVRASRFVAITESYVSVTVWFWDKV